MSTLAERKEELIELFEWIEDDSDRYELIIDKGKSLLPFPEKDKTEEHEVKGCQSKVWLTHSFENGKIYFFADSNTVITKGIVAIMVFLWNDLTPDEILHSDLEILEQIGLRKHLTSQRNNGLTAMILKMKKIAEHYG